VLAFIGGVAAFYLTLFQWNVVKTIWEPFFSGGPGYANGSAKILKSPTSEIFPWPITDGFLGFLGYVFDAVFGLIGGTRRWRTMPWVVILFGVMVGPLGAISIGLVITQPLAYNTFCTLCMFTAVVSVLMIGPAMDEMLASLQYMKRVHERGLPFWRYFWGRAEQEYLPDPAAEAAARVSDVRYGTDRSAVKRRRGIAIAGQVIVALTGLYLMAAPAIWGYAGAPEKIDRFIGPLVASFATMAVWEVLRNLRWLNVALALVLAALAVSPWPWTHPADAMTSDLIAAALIVVLTLIPYPAYQRYGGGWQRLWRRRGGSGMGREQQA
jgi:uncharacterized membrane protein